MNLLKKENIPDDEKVFLHFFIAKIYENNSIYSQFFKLKYNKMAFEDYHASRSTLERLENTFKNGYLQDRRL